jgi:hypothetical protein
LRFTAVLEKFYRGNNIIVMVNSGDGNLTFVLTQAFRFGVVCGKDAGGMMLWVA